MRLQRIVPVFLFLATVIALLVPVARAQSPDTPAFAARGPYLVGVREFVIADDERPLPVTVWYPALNPTGAPETTVYRPDLFPIPGQAIADAPPDVAGGPYPLVIFSHGFGGLRYQSTYLTEHLASYGFVVMAADHPGSTFLDLLGEDVSLDEVRQMLTGSESQGELLERLMERGRAERGLELMSVSLALRPLDVLREIAFAETLTAANGALAGAIDLQRIAVSGHSFGGYTAVAAGGAQLDLHGLGQWCTDPQGVSFNPQRRVTFRPEPLPAGQALTVCLARLTAREVAELRGLAAPPAGLWPPTTDPRIRAVLVLAPWNAPIFGADGLAALDVPLMVQVGSADSTTPPERDAYLIYTGVSSPQKALVVLQGAGHLVFANQGFGVTDQAWDMERAHALINHFAAAFLRAVLYQDEPAGAALLPAVAGRFDGVLYDRTWPR
jgi:predicted dienelactone hydrolase